MTELNNYAAERRYSGAPPGKEQQATWNMLRPTGSDLLEYVQRRVPIVTERARNDFEKQTIIDKLRSPKAPSHEKAPESGG